MVELRSQVQSEDVLEKQAQSGYHQVGINKLELDRSQISSFFIKASISTTTTNLLHLQLGNNTRQVGTHPSNKIFVPSSVMREDTMLEYSSVGRLLLPFVVRASIAVYFQYSLQREFLRSQEIHRRLCLRMQVCIFHLT